ncbi:hypothetical protein F4861DRAFT_544614 [Xylaria intraflava]|nr:hypothetical protein F4861DRAFT_544614 [Xylaria intraflava]
MSGKQIHQYLKLYNKENSVNQPYIHKFPISFPDDADKRSWSNVQMKDAAKWRHTFSSFLNSKHQNKKVKLGFFSVLTGPSIGNAWKEAPWHCYLIAIIAQANNSNNFGSKFVMILWDCDPVETTEKKISNQAIQRKRKIREENNDAMRTKRVTRQMTQAGITEPQIPVERTESSTNYPEDQESQNDTEYQQKRIRDVLWGKQRSF